MKKLYLTLCLLMAAMFLMAQEVPQAINFQAIARDANSEVMANTQIMIQLTILDGSPQGTQVYREIRSLTTNNYGSFSFQIGRDPYIAEGVFADVDWVGGRKFLKIDYDPTNSLAFNLTLGTIEFVSVPYAFAAGSVSYIDATGANDGDVLAYNATTGRFEPRTLEGGGTGTYTTPNLSAVLAEGNSAGNTTISDLAAPVNANDAVTKSYVDNLIAQLQAAINNLGGGGTVTGNVPTVTTSEASNISIDGATLSGEVTSSGNSPVTARGFMYGTSASNLTQTATATADGSTFSYSLTGLTSGTTYYYKAYATNSAGTGYGGVLSFTTYGISEPTGYTNGYGYVDLGLPSGTKWATCNVGASTPTAYGNYYAWGETTTKTTYNSSTYTYTDNPTTLPSSADAATANWGSGWRMPTYDELNELKTNCTVTWTTQNGVNGRMFTGPNGNSIFLPAAGYYDDSSLYRAGSYGRYWSSSLYSGTASRALYLYIDSSNCDMGDHNRSFGLSVRAVCVSASSTTSAPTVTTSSATNVTAAGATLSGNVTSDGGATVTARGFLYGTNSNNLSQTVQSGSGTGSFTKALTGLTSGTTYCYKAYATNSAGTAYGDVMSFTTENSSTSYSEPTGYTNGYGYVDLGLPSGTRWATCNVGASTPTAYGNYFAWGETTPKETYNWSTYRYCYCNGSYSTLTKYCNNLSYGYNGFTDNLTTLEASDDAATANWGTGWRMPTYDELNELQSNCTVTWTTQNGVNGRLFTGPNGNSIFLPAAGYRDVSELLDVGSYGYYWSSSLGTGSPDYAWYLDFYSDYYFVYSSYRYYGHSVRPVCVSQN